MYSPFIALEPRVFRQQQHPARSRRASLPRSDRAHSGEAAIGQACGMAERSGGRPDGRTGGPGGRSSGRVGVRSGAAVKAGERESGRAGVLARGQAGGLVEGGTSVGQAGTWAGR